MSGVLAKIRSAAPDLTPALRRIAEYTLEHPHKVIYHTVTELADASGSSEGSVIRVCRDLGFSGFQDLKLALAVDLANSFPVSSLPGDHAQGIIQQVAQNALSAIAETEQLLDAKAIDEAAEKILRARRIDIYGVGASGVIAHYFDYKLLRLGLASKAFEDPHLAAMSASRLDASDVAIGISSSGSIVDTVRALELAHQAKAYTIAVTNRMKSPLTAQASCLLLASAPESPLTGGAVLSKIGQLLVLEVLFTVIAQRGSHCAEAIRETATAVVDKSY